MIEKIIEWSANNRFIVILIYLIVIGFGIYSVINLPVDAIPDLSENQVILYTEWMGRSPQIIEDQITFPIVSGLQGLPDVKAVRANSMFGMSFVFVIFEDNVDPYFARSRVLERMNSIQSQLPPGVVPSLGPDGTGVGHIYWYTVESKDYDLGTIRSIQDWYIRYKLASVNGVAEVASIGGYVKQYQVDVNPNELRAYNLTVSDVVNSIQRSNNEVGGKILEVSDAEYFVRGQGYIKTKEDIENTVIKSAANGIPVQIKNVAKVQFGGDPSNITVFGQSAGAGSIQSLCASPLSKDMVSKAISMSGGGLSNMRPGIALDTAQIQCKKMMDFFNKSTLADMRALSFDELTKMATKYSDTTKTRIFFSPVVDNYVLTGTFSETALQGKIADVPYMIGYTANDLMDMYQPVADFCALRSEKSKKPAFAYLFQRQLPGDTSGAFHSADLWYIFHSFKHSWRPFTKGDEELSLQIVDYWTNFAKYGNPNGMEKGIWTPYTKSSPKFMILDVKDDKKDLKMSDTPVFLGSPFKWR